MTVAKIAALCGALVLSGCTRLGFDDSATVRADTRVDTRVDSGALDVPLAEDSNGPGGPEGGGGGQDLGDAATVDAVMPPQQQGLANHYGFEGSLQNGVAGASPILVLRGSPNYIAGLLGTGLRLLAGACMKLPAIHPTMSYALWFRTTEVGPPATLWHEGSAIIDAELCGNPPDGDWGLALADNKLMMIGTRSPAPINDGKWHALVFTHDGASTHFDVYIDGSYAFSGATVKVYSFAGVPWVGLGCNPCNAEGGKVTIDVDELRVYQRVLGEAEIKALSTPP
ncbi:MAG: LamG domain-containing protein [Myxococcales bacterium]|nr:LamG domain-containing protein [Myxococcales bacterium]